MDALVAEIRWLVPFVLKTLFHLAPWFFFAVLLGVLLQHLDLDILARRAFRRSGLLGVGLGGFVGAFSPFCSFTVIPLIARLLRAGVPLSAIMAFWIASPSMDPEIFAISAAALGVPVATARLVGAVALSFGGGLIVLVAEKKGHFCRPLRESPTHAKDSAKLHARSKTGGTTARGGCSEPPPMTSSVPALSSGSMAPSGGTYVDGHEGILQVATCSSCVGTEDPWAADDHRGWREILSTSVKNLSFRRIWRDTGRDSLMLGRWLLVGVLAQAVIVRYVPTGAVASALGDGGHFAIPLAALGGLPLYLNGIGAIPVVQGLLAQGMAPAAAVVFLLGGATTTVPAIAAVRAVVTWRVVFAYLGVALLGSIVVGYVTTPFLGP